MAEHWTDERESLAHAFKQGFLLIASAVLVVVAGLVIAFYAPLSDYQRLNDLESRVAELEQKEGER